MSTSKIENNEDVLNIVYVISDDLLYSVNNEIVTIHHKQDHKIQRFFRKLKLKIPEVKNIELDDKSSFVFLQINGVNTVEDIAKLVDDRFKDKAYPLMENLLMFLNHIEVNEKYIIRK